MCSQYGSCETGSLMLPCCLSLQRAHSDSRKAANFVHLRLGLFCSLVVCNVSFPRKTPPLRPIGCVIRM